MWGRDGGRSWHRWYHLSLMTATFITGELSHFLVGIVSRQMAQEIHYGDIGCVERDNATDAGADCYTYTDNSRSVYRRLHLHRQQQVSTPTATPAQITAGKKTATHPQTSAGKKTATHPQTSAGKYDAHLHRQRQVR